MGAYGWPMATPPRRFFLVERYVPSTPLASIEDAACRLSEAEGGDVRHVITLFVPDEETCLSVFEGRSPDAVADVNGRAGFPFDRIVEIRLFTGA